MDMELEGSSVTPEQITAQPAAMYIWPIEPWDSGFDSDDETSSSPGLWVSGSSNDEDDKILNEMMEREEGKEKKKKEGELNNMGEAQRESLDMLIKIRQDGDMRELSISESTAGRSSPPLYEVELTASDEDDDASVLELVIPMQSRYQRVPTSSPKKTKSKSPTLFSNLFCCLRK